MISRGASEKSLFLRLIPGSLAVMLASSPLPAYAQGDVSLECYKHDDCQYGTKCLRGICIPQEEWDTLVATGRGLRIACVATHVVALAIVIPALIEAVDGRILTTINMDTSFLFLGISTAIHHVGFFLGIAGFIKREKIIDQRVVIPANCKWAWKFNRYWLPYLITGYLLLVAGVATFYPAFYVGIPLAALGIPFIITGHVFKAKSKDYPFASVLPFLSPVPGGAIAGVGAVF